jgi:hypothetical protein
MNSQDPHRLLRPSFAAVATSSSFLARSLSTPTRPLSSSSRELRRTSGPRAKEQTSLRACARVGANSIAPLNGGEPGRPGPAHRQAGQLPGWLLVTWKQATSYCETAFGEFAFANDGVPSLPA